MKKKNFIWIILFVLLCIWQLPQFILSLLIFPFLGRKEIVADRHFNFCLRCYKMRGGISLGPLAFVSKFSGEPVIAHETDGHTMQSKILGWLYLPIIGIESILWARFFYNPEKHCYYDFYTEKNANYFAKLKVDDKCRLQFKK